jgi:phosphatidylserine/phosphatidylglycerophosphate/cardiolipin synthase-like enzyme
MKRLIIFPVLLMLFFSNAYSGPVITDIKYSDMTMSTVKITWKTNIPSDSKIRWMVSDSNYQAITYTDSVYYPAMDTLHSVTLTSLNPFTLYNYNVTSSGSTGSTTTSNKMFATQSTNYGNVNVYFNKSVDTTVSNGVNAVGNINLETSLLTRIDFSGFYIDVATGYFEDAADITSALLKAKRNGVVIRFIYDGKQNSRWIDTLIANGVNVIKRNSDNVNGHCLNTNFWIFDARCTCSGGNIFVWTSSAQIKHSSLVDDKNSAIEINDRTLAYVYTREFDEMWGSFTDLPDTSRARFGSRKTDNIPHLVNLNGVFTEVYFAPSDSVGMQVKNFVTNSYSGIVFGAYDFKSQSLYNTLYQLHTGRNIRGIFDLSNSSNSVYSAMKNWADVWVDSTAGKLHHKYILTDPLLNGPTSKVLMGSYDLTDESDLYNDADIMILHSPVAANLYYQEFHQRYKDASGHAVSIQNISTGIPDGYKLYQNYPNPFNGQTVIRFAIARTADVKLDVYNSLGQKVNSLVNARFAAGTYEVKFNSSELSSGVYYYIFRSDTFNEVKKFVLIK